MSVAQPLSALIFTFLGFCFGVFFDLYRVLRRFNSPGKLLTAATDLLFWFTYTVWVYIVLLRVNAGEVRVFLLFCLTLGAIGYFLWLSGSMVQAWVLVFNGLVAMMIRLQQAVEAVLRVIIWPFRMLELYLLTPLVNLIGWLLQPFVRLTAAANNSMRVGARRLTAKPRSYLKARLKSLADFWRPPPLDE